MGFATTIAVCAVNLLTPLVAKSGGVGDRLSGPGTNGWVFVVTLPFESVVVVSI